MGSWEMQLPLSPELGAGWGPSGFSEKGKEVVGMGTLLAPRSKVRGEGGLESKDRPSACPGSKLCGLDPAPAWNGQAVIIRNCRLWAGHTGPSSPTPVENLQQAEVLPSQRAKWERNLCSHSLPLSLLQSEKDKTKVGT